MHRATRVTLNLKALRHNLQTLKKWNGEGEFFCPMVKANAYGHGIIEVSRALIEEKSLYALGVATLSEALYLNDPDGNGVELYWDRHPDSWHGSAGELVMGHRPIDPDEILNAADEAT